MKADKEAARKVTAGEIPEHMSPPLHASAGASSFARQAASECKKKIGPMCGMERRDGDAVGAESR